MDMRTYEALRLQQEQGAAYRRGDEETGNLISVTLDEIVTDEVAAELRLTTVEDARAVFSDKTVFSNLGSVATDFNMNGGE